MFSSRGKAGPRRRRTRHNACARSNRGSCRPRNRESQARTAGCPGSNCPAAPGARRAVSGPLPQSIRGRRLPPAWNPSGSWLVHPVALPDRTLVKRIGDRQQIAAHRVEKQPRGQEAGQSFNNHDQTGQTVPTAPCWSGQSLQTRGTNHAVLVFRNALATEELPAFRTTGDRLPKVVIQTALMNEGRHGLSWLIGGTDAGISFPFQDGLAGVDGAMNGTTAVPNSCWAWYPPGC